MRAAVLLVLRSLSPVLVGGLLGGWTSWTLLPGAVALLLAMLRRPYLGLIVSLAMEMAALHRHGLVAFVFLMAIWFAWLHEPGWHLVAATLLAVGGLAAVYPPVRVTGLATALAVTSATMGELVKARRERQIYETLQ